MSDTQDRKQLILRLLREANAPVSLKLIAERVLGSSGKKQLQHAHDLLSHLKVRGDIFEFPPERAGYGVRFSRVSPSEWLSVKIVNLLKRAGGRLTQRQVQDKLHQWEKRYFDEALEG